MLYKETTLSQQFNKSNFNFIFHDVKIEIIHKLYKYSYTIISYKLVIYFYYSYTTTSFSKAKQAVDDLVLVIKNLTLLKN